MPGPYIKRILSARVYDVAVETPIDEMPALSRELGNRVKTKREDLQPVFSFKLRGAYHKISCLSPTVRQRGVVAASAGNHAQGVALSSRALQTSATIVMPLTTPAIKVQSTKALGGKNIQVVLHGDRFDEACTLARTICNDTGATFIHPYDDPDVIAGQGTIGLEIMRQCTGPLDYVFVPVGGGGLLAGIGVYLKYVRPQTKIIAVEAQESACLKAALKAGRRVTLPHVGIFADGVAVAQIGKETFRLARKIVDDIVTVNNDEICAAIKKNFDDTRSIAEPAGALSLAGLIKYARRKKLRHQSMLAINSGANVNFDRLRYVSERYGIGQQTEALFAITIGESAGTLLLLCQALGSYDITEFNYRTHDPKVANIFVGLKLPHGGDDTRKIIQKLRKHGLKIQDLSGNKMAKLHVGHMIGGRLPAAQRERIFRFEFPERPGILQEFLTMMRSRWNISLFHYRQHGGTYANVLIGLQALPDQDHAIEDFLKEWPYPSWEETNNTACKLFLRS
ncbi:threonine ammonia-lyase, biosynthetic [Planctomycetota bacterium]